MKTPIAKQLPSGNWRVQIQVDGKRYSCTAESEDEAKAKAKLIFAGIETKKKIPLTVGKAMDKYILEKTGTLSPSTIQGYKVIRKNYFQDLMDIQLSDLTHSDIQLAVSEETVAGKSSKTVRNAHGFLAAVLDEFHPDFVLKTRLPQKKKYEAKIFTEDEIKKVWNALKGTEYELPFLLASWLGLRMSEIRGIKYGDIKDERIHIQRALVAGPGGYVEKGTKTTSGDRWIKLPNEILMLIDIKEKDPKETVCKLTGAMIYKRFIKVCDELGIEPCRFHDLRHFAASEALALGVPDKYSMQRMGHATDHMLKTVYQHTMKDKEDEFSDLIDGKMRKIFC